MAYNYAPVIEYFDQPFQFFFSFFGTFFSFFFFFRLDASRLERQWLTY